MDAEPFAVLGWGVSLLTALAAQRLFDPLGASPALGAWRLATTATALVAMAWSCWIAVLGGRQVVAYLVGEIADR